MIDETPLAALPQPRLVDPLDYEALLAQRKARFAEAAVEHGLPEMADYLVLESASETILLQEAAYAELLLRSRINELYRSRLLYFGVGADLDHTADEYGVDRLPGETDADLRTRVRIRNRGSSAAGSDDWWRYYAMTAHPDVRDVAVTRPMFPFPAPDQARGQITLSVLAKSAAGVPSEAVLAAVTAVVTSTAVRGATTVPRIVAATSAGVSVRADVWLRPNAQPSVFDGLAAAFRTAFAAEQSLGFDVVDSWVKATLMQPGVQRVELPGWQNVIVGPAGAPRLDAVTLTLRGRDF